LNVRENRHPAGDFEGHIPALRRYARGLIGRDHADPVAVADDLVRQAVERERLADRSPWRGTPRLRLFASLTSLNRTRLRATHVTSPQPKSPDRSLGVQDALARTQIDDREALLLVVVEGFSYAQAALILGVSRLCVANRLARARQCLSGPQEAASAGQTPGRPAHPPYLRLVK